MTDLLRHNREILARGRNLAPLEPELRRIYVEGKRAQLLAGRDAQGGEFAAIKPATAKSRGGAGPPLAPRGAASDIISRYSVRFEWLSSVVRIVAGWPMNWVQYHRTGTSRMPRRDPGGFRPQDRKAAMDLVREYVMRGRG